MTATTPDPQPGDLWLSPKGRTVEILARDIVVSADQWSYPEAEIDTVAYRALGGSMVRLRAVSFFRDWTKVGFE